MSHELRTPLNAIIGFASIMQQGIRGPIDALYVEDAKIIADSGSHLLAIINDILDIAKAEAQALDLSEDLVDIAETVRFSADMVADMAKNSDVTCSFASMRGCRGFWGDAKKLRQVMINLLSNAIKFTPSGAGVSLGAQREADGGVAISIADTGIGIAPSRCRWRWRRSARWTAASRENMKASGWACRCRSASSRCTTDAGDRKRARPGDDDHRSAAGEALSVRSVGRAGCRQGLRGLSFSCRPGANRQAPTINNYRQ